MTTITPKELKRRLDDSGSFRLLDVREPEEHAHCALPDSRLLPLSELEARWQELEEWCASGGSAQTVVYCHHGVRSAHAIAFLEEKGFSGLVNLTGGIDRWSREADPSVPRYW
jgi:adenylyltransferase/sulfurtransferase